VISFDPGRKASGRTIADHVPSLPLVDSPDMTRVVACTVPLTATARTCRSRLPARQRTLPVINAGTNGPDGSTAS